MKRTQQCVKNEPQPHPSTKLVTFRKKNFALLKIKFHDIALLLRYLLSVFVKFNEISLEYINFNTCLRNKCVLKK